MAADRGEILRYLGASEAADTELHSLIDSCQEELQDILSPRYIYKIVSPQEHTEIYRGRAIAKHLQGACHWALMAATLGGAVDRRIDKYQVGNLARGLVLYACATAAIEAVCQELEAAIHRDDASKGLFLGPRFSPGYGDYPLSIQPKFLAILDAGRQIGLMCTRNFILIPKKSVTAIAALRPREDRAKLSCTDCSLHGDCPYKRRNINGKNNI